MLSALRPQAPRPGLPRPLRGRLAVGVPAAVRRSGDGAGEQRPAGRRPKPRPPPADQAQLSSPQQRQQQQQQQQGGVPGGPRLTQLIQAAKSVEQVVQLVQQAGQQCNAFHFSAAANRIAKLQQRRPSASNQAAFAALLAFADQHPVVLNHVAVAQTVYAGGVLQHQLTAEQRAAWQERLVWAFSQPELQPKELSNSLWGWSRMGLPLQSHMATAADAAMAQLAGQMKPQAVSNILLAFANTGWLLSIKAAAALLQRLEQVLPHAEPQAVANSLWAAAKLGLQLNGSLSAGSVAAIQRTAGQMGSQGVSNTLWAHANAGWPLDSKAAAVLLQRLEHVLPQAKPQAVANSLWAAAKLGLQLSNSLKAAFAQALQRVIPVAKPQELANSLLACGKLRWSPGGRVLAAAVAAVQRCLWSEPNSAGQALRNFLWGLAELQEQLSIRLSDELPALLATTDEWADSRWAQLSALDVVDLCYNLARLGHRPGSAWIGSAINRCLECIEADALEGARFANFIWACSSWGHRLQRSELEQLVPAAVNNVATHWEGGGRGGGLLLGEALTRQEAFQVGAGCPAATAALEGRLLPLVCADIDLIAIDQLHPETGELPYLAGWSAHLAAIGLRLPEQQLEAVCSYVRQHPQPLRPRDASKLEGAFADWSYKPGLALLGQLAGA